MAKTLPVWPFLLTLRPLVPMLLRLILTLVRSRLGPPSQSASSTTSASSGSPLPVVSPITGAQASSTEVHMETYDEAKAALDAIGERAGYPTIAQTLAAWFPNHSQPAVHSGDSSMSFLSNFNLASFATSLVTVAQKVETAVADAKLVYTYAANVIHAAETAYAGQTNAGATKKAAVLAATEAFATSLGANWSLLEAGLSAWIDVVIAGYNAAAVVMGTPQVNQAKVDAAVATVQAVATPVVTTAASIANSNGL